MSDDLVERLRTFDIYDYADADKICREAAARIAELEAVLNQAKQHFRADEPLKAFIEICAALVGGEDGRD